MMLDPYERFISDFCQWADRWQLPRASRVKLPGALRRLTAYELLDRDGTEVEIFRPICEGTRLTLSFRTAAVVVLTTGSSADGLVDLIAGVRTPSWRRGWSKFARDDALSDAFALFFDRMVTYIARSQFLNCTAAIGFAYKTDCTFQYGSWGSERHVPQGTDWGAPPTRRSPNSTPGDLPARSVGGRSPRQRYLNAVMLRLNALDPHIHRMLYCYLRALRLRNDEFWEDSVISLDSAVRIAAELVRDRRPEDGANRYEVMLRELGLGPRTDLALGDLRTLRNYFGAHPGEAGFWDFPDDRADDVVEMFEAVEQLIWAAAGFEAAHRHVPPVGDSKWSDWFRAHAQRLGNIVWFRLATVKSKPLSVLEQSPESLLGAARPTRRRSPGS